MNRRHHSTRLVAAWLVSLLVFGSLVAEDNPDPKSGQPVEAEKSAAEKLAAQRLEFMKSSLKDYEFVLAPDFKAKLGVEPEPLLRRGWLW